LKIEEEFINQYLRKGIRRRFVSSFIPLFDIVCEEKSKQPSPTFLNLFAQTALSENSSVVSERLPIRQNLLLHNKTSDGGYFSSGMMNLKLVMVNLRENLRDIE
jgi:hypothetical protein